jgi:hypothetical protein
MRMCRVTNLTSMSMVIEDIGVRLNPSWGRDGSAVIRASVAESSSDLKRCQASKWVKVENFEISSPIKAFPPPVMAPVSAPALFSAPPLPPPDPAPISTAERAELEGLRQSVDQMRSRQDELFDLLRSALSDRPAGKPADRPAQPFEAVPPPDPVVLLPGSLLPESVEISVRASESTLQRDDFDSAIAALKRAKGR